MDVTAGVDARFDAFDSVQQIFAPGVETVVTLVEDAGRGAVGNQYVGVGGDFVPMLANVCAAFAVECPVTEFGLDGRTPEFHPVNFDAGIVEVNEAVFFEDVFGDFAAFVFCNGLMI